MEIQTVLYVLYFNFDCSLSVFRRCRCVCAHVHVSESFLFEAEYFAIFEIVKLIIIFSIE